MMTKHTPTLQTNRFTLLGKRLLAASLALALAAPGCTTNPFTTTDPYTGESEINKTTKGAGIGALAGLVTAVIVGGDRKKLLAGAGIGALAGGGVGYYMDRQEDKLRMQLQSSGVSVSRSGDSIILNMPGNVTFATGSSDISADFYSVLNSVVLVLNEFEKTYIDISGHTDNTGSASLNQQLSESRANSVSRYFQSQGVVSQRIITQGMSFNHPIDSNDTPEGRAMNRRVEILLTPIT